MSTASRFERSRFRHLRCYWGFVVALELATILGSGAVWARDAPDQHVAENAETGGLTVAPVVADDVVGEIGVAIPLAITVRSASESSASSTFLLGLPEGAFIADRIHGLRVVGEAAVVEISDWNLANLTVTLLPEQVGDFTVTVASLAQFADGRPLRLDRAAFTLRAKAHPPAAGPPAGAGEVAPLVARADPATDLHAPVLLDTGRVPETAVSLVAPSTPPSAATNPSAAEPSAPALVARAERLIQSGDISGARRLLERAMSRGDTHAAYRLAQTWDAKVLRAWKVRGLRPDADRAQALYARAAREAFAPSSEITEAAR